MLPVGAVTSEATGTEGETGAKLSVLCGTAEFKEEAELKHA